MRGSQIWDLGEDFLKMSWIEENVLRQQSVNNKEMKKVYFKTMYPAVNNGQIHVKYMILLFFLFCFILFLLFVKAVCFDNRNIAPEQNNMDA